MVWTLGVQVDCHRPNPALAEEALHSFPSDGTLRAAVNQGNDRLRLYLTIMPSRIKPTWES